MVNVKLGALAAREVLPRENLEEEEDDKNLKIDRMEEVWVRSEGKG
jgi:hypothetical protein